VTFKNPAALQRGFSFTFFRKLVGEEDSRTYKIEPQNIEQEILNIEGKKQNFIIRHSLFNIRYSFFKLSRPLPAVFVAGRILLLLHP